MSRAFKSALSAESLFHTRTSTRQHWRAQAGPTDSRATWIAATKTACASSFTPNALSRRPRIVDRRAARGGRTRARLISAAAAVLLFSQDAGALFRFET